MLRKALRVLVLLATTSLVVCGVKGAPHPPHEESADAGVPDGGAP
jgi:hypothetical protein